MDFNPLVLSLDSKELRKIEWHRQELIKLHIIWRHLKYMAEYFDHTLPANWSKLVVWFLDRNPNFVWRIQWGPYIGKIRRSESNQRTLKTLRVVQIQAILFLKSTSERGGSDIERIWNWISSTLSLARYSQGQTYVTLCYVPFFTKKTLS